MGTAACTNPAVGRAWAYASEIPGSAQQTYACSRCAQTALAWLGLYVGRPAHWTQLVETGRAVSDEDEEAVVVDPSDRDRLSRIADDEQAKLNTLMVVSKAEGVVHTARITELAALQKAAWRRVSAARGQLTKARRDGSATKIVTAAQRLRELEGEADRFADAAIRESQELMSAGLAGTGQLFDQMDRSWDAHAAVTETYRDPGRKTDNS